jgi:hypothetical protein
MYATPLFSAMPLLSSALSSWRPPARPAPRRLLAEAIGTAILVMFGAGSVVAALPFRGGELDYAGLGMVAITFGLAIALAIYAFGNASGAHLNPAVTVFLAGVGRFPWSDAPGYIAAQVAGGLAGPHSSECSHLSLPPAPRWAPASRMPQPDALDGASEFTPVPAGTTAGSELELGELRTQLATARGEPFRAGVRLPMQRVVAAAVAPPGHRERVLPGRHVRLQVGGGLSQLCLEPFSHFGLPIGSVY